MHTIAFFPATWNLAETTRTIQVAKACKDDFKIAFASYGGQFEELVEKEGFPLTRLSPRLSAAQIEYMYKVDQGEKLGTFFTVQETRERVESELRFLEKVRPLASVTGFNVTTPISSRAANVPLVWLTQSTWDFNAMMDQGLGSYIDDLDRPILRCLPETALKWLTKHLYTFIGRIVLRPLNAVSREYGLEPFRDIQDLWNRYYNLMAEPDDFSGLRGVPQASRFIGPLIADLGIPVPGSVRRLAEKDEYLVYFAMGSSGRPNVIRKILEGFRDQAFQVVSPMKSNLKELQVDVPNNVLLTDWLPALEVSRLADISVIHGGIGTVMTAALAGKPVVGIGMMPEQEYNIDCLVRKGFAKRIRRTRVSPESVNEAILTLLNDEGAKQKAADYSRKVEIWLRQRDQKINSFFRSLAA
jgi:UDP:flavonoid glycosyltransferase YjiC (YdhE family)